jgi:UDPglucose 6-dehydrogenase
MNSISLFGLGKLGAVLAGCYASRGFQVVGVDVDRRAVESCDRGVAPVEEPGIEELYRSAGSRLRATVDGAAAVLETDTTFVIVPTPSEPDGGYSLKYVLETCAVIGQALRKKNRYHLVVLKSTVSPGSCDSYVIPALEAHSGKQCGVDFGFCYNPEFIALGSVIYNVFNPDLTLIGETDAHAGNCLLEMHARLLPKEAPMSRMNVVNAELTKLAVNTYVTIKISFANLMAQLCERLPGGNVDAVTTALGRDTRIGSKYIKGGLGYGGPCFPRDNAAMLSLARRLGVTFPLAEATDAANRAIPGRIADLVASLARAQGRIGILGLSYKPDTPVIDESQAILIAQLLLKRGFAVQAYDPLAMESARKVFAGRMQFMDSAQACIQNADVVLIATPWKQFRTLDYAPDGANSRATVIDCWGLLDGIDPNGASVIRVGINSSAQLNDRPQRTRSMDSIETVDELER